MIACYLAVITQEAYYVQTHGITESSKDNQLISDFTLDCLYVFFSTPAGLRLIPLPLQILARAGAWQLIRCGEA